jgi:two-component system invasion response regulator UvrY
MTAMALHILLVDNNQLFLSAVRNLLAPMSEVEIVGEAHDGVEGLLKVKELQPDLILLDIAMPKMTGLDVALRIQSWAQPPKILFLTMHDDTFYRDAASDLGAIGVVGKTDLVADLLPIIRRIIADKNSKTFQSNG